MKVLGVLFGLTSFSSYFMQDALDKNVHHGEGLSKLGDVQVAFRILF
jgi:hypothetical protein